MAFFLLQVAPRPLTSPVYCYTPSVIPLISGWLRSPLLLLDYMSSIFKNLLLVIIILWSKNASYSEIHLFHSYYAHCICSRSLVSLLFKRALFSFLIPPLPKEAQFKVSHSPLFSLSFAISFSYKNIFPCLTFSSSFHSIQSLLIYLHKKPRADPKSAASAVLKEPKKALYFLRLSSNFLSCKLIYKAFLEVARRFPYHLQQH